MKKVIPFLLLAGAITCSAGCGDKPTVVMPTANGQPKPVGESGVAGGGKDGNVVNEKLEAPAR